MKIGLRIAIAAMLVCGAIPAFAQTKKAAVAPRKPPAPPKPAKRPQANPAKELDQFSKMSPQDREQALAKLPPARRAAVEQRLARYQNMTPEQQEKFKAHLEIMKGLPKDRQQAVRQEIERLRAMPPRDRRAALNAEELKQNFSPDEQKLVHDSFPFMKSPE
jgi:Protein of unknown function (DUF3106)